MVKLLSKDSAMQTNVGYEAKVERAKCSVRAIHPSIVPASPNAASKGLMSSWNSKGDNVKMESAPWDTNW
jgi:hypothetical protein